MLGILVSGLVSGFLNVAAAQQLSELTQKAALQAALAQFLSEAGSADGSFAVLNPLADACHHTCLKTGNQPDSDVAVHRVRYAG